MVVRHFDPYSQALSKIERGFDQDLADVASMVSAGLIDPERAQELFEQIEPELFRYPAIDAVAFRAKVARALGAAR
jgi:histidinol-phosphate/aromatic aminotransferase/cobyric acid decarboxylase-like protein